MTSGPLKPYFDHVFVLFWPVLWWNLIRVARWQMRTGQDALLMVNCFGGIRFVQVKDAPCPQDANRFTPRLQGFVIPERAQLLSGTQNMAWEIFCLGPGSALRSGQDDIVAALAPQHALPLPET